MNRDDIIRMAEKAKFLTEDDEFGMYAQSDFDGRIRIEEYACGERLEEFANLIADAAKEEERKACEAICFTHGAQKCLEEIVMRQFNRQPISKEQTLTYKFNPIEFD